MTTAKAIAEFISGMQNIERGIIARVRAAGIPITAENFIWNHGKDIVRLPMNTISLEIRVQGRSTNAVFGREQVMDSCAGMDRPDVLKMVKDLSADLMR